jgi:hypothetical protein
LLYALSSSLGCSGALPSLPPPPQALVAAAQLRVLAVALTDLPVPGARKLVSAARQLAPPPKQPPSLECHLQVGAARVQGLDALEVLLVEDEGALIANAWQDITGGPSFEPSPPPPPPGGCSAGEGPGTAGGTAVAAPVAGGAARPASPPPPAAASPDGVAPAPPRSPPSLPSAGGSGGAAAAPAPHPPGPRLVFFVVQADAAGALARVPEVLGDMDTMDLSGLGLGNAGAREVAQVGGAADGAGTGSGACMWVCVRLGYFAAGRARGAPPHRG